MRLENADLNNQVPQSRRQDGAVDATSPHAFYPRAEGARAHG